MSGINVPNASGAMVVCGKCNISIELHPHDNCIYEYPIVRGPLGKPIGYFMLRKKEPKKEEENGLRDSGQEQS